MIKAIIFDFDGVILESASIKTDAFAEIVRDYPLDIAKKFVEYHKSHMGISRKVKFSYFITNILKETYSEEKVEKMCERFSEIVYNKVMNCSFVPGAKEFLDNNYFKLDFYIASGTPVQELQEIMKRRCIKKYFKEVYGSPMKKEEIIAHILTNNTYKRQEVLFVGDAITDLNAASNTGLLFIGRNTEDNYRDFILVKNKVDNLLQIENIIEEIQ